mmetsp:Transcript_9342/g.18802  ORF Transcript_9342/g.18802 Transcript_9342/m.18802 type:complete len:513 (-) Transcript_9342:155-1693(-)
MAAQKPPQQLTREQAHGILDEVLPQFNSKDFQRKMRELWDSTPDYFEKVKLRQELCLEIQGPVIAKYGYKATPAGVSKSSSQIMKLMSQDPYLSVKGVLNNWLVSHLEHTGDKRVDLEGRHTDEYWLHLTRAHYKVSVTSPDDAGTLRALEKVRGAMVETHQALYEPFYPGIRPNEWLEVLGPETIKKSLESGIVMLHAELAETGEVVGYISCTEGADDEQFVGSWSCSSDSSLSHQITCSADRQMRVEGVFFSGTSSGSGTLASQGKYLEAKIASSADGRRVGAARFSIAGPGCMLVSFRLAGEQEWQRELMYHRVGPPPYGQDEGPHMKINHVVVLPGHTNRGVARLLFQEFLQHLGKGSVNADLRLSVVEQNARAISWYFKLGFSIVRQHVAHISTLKHGHVPVVFLDMQRRRGMMAPPRGRMFGREVGGEKVILIPDYAPMLFISLVQLRVLYQLPGVAIRAFDQASGLHRLEDGRVADLSEAFSRGLLVFERPLHAVLATPSRGGGA